MANSTYVFKNYVNTGSRVLQTVTASASANVSLTSFDNSSYRWYQIAIYDYIPATDNTSLFMRTSTDGGSTYDSGASDYEWTWDNWAYGDATTGAQSDTADSEIEIYQAIGNAANERLSCFIELLNPGAAAYTTCFFKGRSNIASTGVSAHFDGSGTRLSAADVDAVQFTSSSGNITSGIFVLTGHYS